MATPATAAACPLTAYDYSPYGLGLTLFQFGAQPTVWFALDTRAATYIDVVNFQPFTLSPQASGEAITVTPQFAADNLAAPPSLVLSYESTRWQLIATGENVGDAGTIVQNIDPLTPLGGSNARLYAVERVGGTPSSVFVLSAADTLTAFDITRPFTSQAATATLPIDLFVYSIPPANSPAVFSVATVPPGAAADIAQLPNVPDRYFIFCCPAALAARLRAGRTTVGAGPFAGAGSGVVATGAAFAGCAAVNGNGGGSLWTNPWFWVLTGLGVLLLIALAAWAFSRRRPTAATAVVPVRPMM